MEEKNSMLLSLITSGGFGETGSWLGTAGSGFGVASAFIDRETDRLGLFAGILSLLSGGMEITKGIGGLYSHNQDDITNGILDTAEGVIGVLSSGADIGAHIFGLAGNHKGKGILKMVSGGMGVLGGLFTGGRGIYDLIKANTMEDSEKNIARGKALLKMISGANGIFRGITKIGIGAHIYKGDSDAAKGWKIAGKASAISTSVLGILNSIVGTVGADN